MMVGLAMGFEVESCVIIGESRVEHGQKGTWGRPSTLR